MISVATLDPSSLTLWVDFSQLAHSPAKEPIQEAWDIAFGSRPWEMASYLSTISEAEVAARCAHVMSSLWHEQRHFLDLLLTNYGAFRVRQFFELYINADFILHTVVKDKVQLHCPLHVYADPVISRFRGITYQNQDVSALAKAMKRRREAIESDQFIINTAAGPISAGGEAQLEALAVFFQIAASQAHIGDPAVWQSDLHNWTSQMRYRWAEYVGQVMDLAPVVRSNDNEVAGVDASLLIPMIYGSLMMRGWGQEQRESDNGASGLPSDRLAGLINSFQGFHFEFGELDIGEAWSLVNEHAKQLWGRSIHEELEEDFEQEARYCSRVAEFEYVPDCVMKALHSYHDLRGRLLALLVTNPKWFLDGNEFSYRLLPALNPIVVNAIPAGAYGAPPKDMQLVYGYKHPDYNAEDGTWWWAAAQHAHGGIELGNTHEWLDIVSFYAPLAKIMMNGRRHKTMLGPEILSVQKRLEARGISIKIDPLYLFPEQQATIDNVYYLQMRDTLTCDWCHTPTRKPSGRLISPWLFRLNSHNAAMAVKGLGGGIAGELRFLKDWSYWVFCDDCASRLF
jgi:hypothetical protein